MFGFSLILELELTSIYSLQPSRMYTTSRVDRSKQYRPFIRKAIDPFMRASLLLKSLYNCAGLNFVRKRLQKSNSIRERGVHGFIIVFICLYSEKNLCANILSDFPIFPFRTHCTTFDFPFRTFCTSIWSSIVDIQLPN